MQGEPIEISEEKVKLAAASVGGPVMCEDTSLVRPTAAHDRTASANQIGPRHSADTDRQAGPPPPPPSNEIVSNMLFTISHLHCCMVCMAIGILNLKALYLDSYLET